MTFLYAFRILAIAVARPVFVCKGKNSLNIPLLCRPIMCKCLNEEIRILKFFY